MSENKFKVKIVGIVFDPEKKLILIGKNRGDANYTFVEELLNQTEELDSCLKRSVNEKTGYKVHNLGSVYAKNFIEEEKDLLELFFLCEATEGSEKPGKEVEELKWINPCDSEKIMEIKFPSRLREFILGLGENCSLE